MFWAGRCWVWGEVVWCVLGGGKGVEGLRRGGSVGVARVRWHRTSRGAIRGRGWRRGGGNVCLGFRGALKVGIEGGRIRSAAMRERREGVDCVLRVEE